MALSTDAVCINAKCEKNHQDFYMMYYKSFDNVWVRTYGKKEKPYQSGGSGQSVAVNLSPSRIGPQFKCPHCGNKYTFTCWNCGKQTCYDGDNHEGRVTTCGHCGKTGVFRKSAGGSKTKSHEIYGFGVTGQ